MNEKNEFFQKIFNFVENDKLLLSTKFKDLALWNSLNALIIHSNIEKHYNVKINNEEMNEIQTINDLWKLIQKNKKHDF